MKLTDDTPLETAQKQQGFYAPPAAAPEEDQGAAAVAGGDAAAGAAGEEAGEVEAATMSPSSPAPSAEADAAPAAAAAAAPEEEGVASPPRNAAPSPTPQRQRVPNGAKPPAEPPASAGPPDAPPRQAAGAPARSGTSPPPPAGVTVRDDVTFFVERALKKLVTLMPKKHADVKQALELVVAAVGKKEKAIKLPSSPTALVPVQAYTKVLRSVCETNEPKAVQAALDCMQKIMAFGDISDQMKGSLPMMTFAQRANMPVPKGEEEAWKEQKVGLLTEIVVAIASCSTTSTATTQLQAVKALHTAVETKAPHAYALRLAVHTLFSVAVRTVDPITAQTARTALTQVVDRIYKSPAKEEDQAPSAPGSALTIAEHDASHVMSVLCAEALSVEITDATPPEAPEMKVLTQALDTIEKMLIQSRAALKNSAAFLKAIRVDLLTVMTRHVMSPSAAVVKSTLEIFVCITTSLFHFFKHEVGYVFTQVLMKVLTSQHSSYDQRLLVANAVHKVAQHPQTVIDLYVNFDCDLSEDLVMKDIIGGLSRFIMSAPATNVDWITPKQDSVVKGYALQALVSMLRSMEKWIAQGGAQETNGKDGQHPAAEFATTERNRALKVDIDAVSVLMAEKPLKGVKLLVERGLAENTPASIAAALEKYQRLDRLAVGEYVGDEKCPEGLKAFCEIDNYKGMTLDAAIRRFTTRFSLPKEGQKIERILEAFATCFYEQNREAGDCQTEEAVFVLTVGIVMLNTDLHNPKITNKMTPDKFKTQFKGVNGGGDFADGYLQTLYDNVRDDPMKDTNAAANTDVKEKDEGGGLFAAAFTSKRDRKVAAYALEGQRIIESAVASIEALSSKPHTYARAVQPEHAKPMFAASWTALLACFSRYFESDDPSTDVVKLCLEGMAKSIHICSAFDLRTEREAFLRGLCIMTNTTDKGKPITERNILAIKSLLRVPYTDGDTLSSSWLALLRAAAEIEALRVLGTQQKQKPQTAPDFNHNARQVMQEIDEDMLNKIIARSTQVSQLGLKEFVCHLCTVALEEVKRPTGARTFLLSRVVEVASDNMGPRLLPIWKDISQLLVAVGTHAMADVACQGVDNLRQLVMKSLGRPELQQCQIQPELMTPFYGIMESSLPSREVRALVLECLTQVVVAKLECLGAGLPVLLKTLIVGISRHKDKNALDVTVGVVSTLLHHNSLPHVSTYFREIVYALTYVASDASLNKPLSLKACITLFGLPERVATFLPEAGGEHTVTQLWHHVLEAFAALSLAPDPDVRQRAIKELTAALVISTAPLPPQGQVSAKDGNRGPKKVTFSDPIEEVAPPPLQAGEATTGLYKLPTSPTPVTGKRKKRAISEAVWHEWGHGFLASCVVQPLGKSEAEFEPFRQASAFAYLRHYEADGTVERVAAKEWHRSTLPGLVESLLVGVVQNNIDQPEFRQQLDRVFPMLLAVLRRLCEEKVLRVVHLAGDCLMRLFACAAPHLSSATWANASLQLTAIFEACMLHPDQIAEHITDADDTTSALLEYDAALEAHPFPTNLLGAVESTPQPAEEPVDAPLLRRSSSSAVDPYQGKASLYIDDPSAAVALLGTPEGEPIGMAEEVALRCARQASMVALFESLFLRGPFDWTTAASALGADDFLRMYRCAKLCTAFFNVFFSSGLRKWRSELAPDLVDQVRKRRCKALRLIISLVFRAYNTERTRIRDTARADFLTDSLSLIECYEAQQEWVEVC
eukprot:TRINITY_DN3154_c0_g2_i2.p1 TRINITY_DN3154_c0_g2~~TRINITY_DN3154_c0_g2_i2.p1  ORF type:complete len:1721 (+),score=736.83 TRINITY_DN3154_c0_g2_i2:80-5242(+)